MPRIVLLSTSDSDLLSARTSAADYRWANPAKVSLDELAGIASIGDLVVLRVLGSPASIRSELDAVRGTGRPLVVLGGEQLPDASLMALSSVPIGTAAQAHLYLAQGGPANLRSLHAFLSDTVLLTGEGFDPPADQPVWGELPRPGRGSATGPRVGIVFYRAQYAAGNTAYVEALADAIDAAGGIGVPIFAASLRDAPAELIDHLGTLDALITTVLAAGGTRPSTVGAGGDDEAWDVRALAGLDIPVLQGLCLTSDRATWASSNDGMSPLDVATQVAVPEFDGRIITVPFSFKEIDADGLPRYVPDPERCRRVAEIAVNHARLRRIPADERKIAIVLSAYPTKHSRIGNAVGLDTPVSLIRLLRALRGAGYDLGRAGRDSRHRAAAGGRGRGARHDGRQRPDPCADRGRRPGPGVADRRPAVRAADPDPGRDVRRLVRRATGRASIGGHDGLGERAGRAVRRPLARPARRDRRRRPAGRQRRDPGPASARLRGEPDRDLPRSRSCADAPLSGDVPLDRAGVRRARHHPPRASTATWSGCPARHSACLRPAAPTPRSGPCR